MTETAPLTSPLEVQRYIGHLLRQKSSLIDAAKDAEIEAHELRREATKAYARAYLNSDGPAHAKRYVADLDPAFDRANQSADVAEAVLRHLRERIKHCADSLDGARTAAATLRAEFSVLGMGPEER